MTDRNETVRLAIYSALAGTGRLPSEAELVEETGLVASELAEAMDELAASRHLVFDGEHRIAWCPLDARPWPYALCPRGGTRLPVPSGRPQTD